MARPRPNYPLQFGVLFCICCACWLTWHGNKARRDAWTEVEQWLLEARIPHLANVLKQADIRNLAEGASMKLSQHPALQQLDEVSGRSLQIAVRQLHDKLLLSTWLAEHGLEDFAVRLRENRVVSLDDVACLPEWVLQKVTAVDVTLKGYSILKNRVNELKDRTGDLAKVKEKYWKLYLRSTKKAPWHLGVMIMFSVFMASLLLLVNMNYTTFSMQQTHSNKHSILEYVTGRYLAIQCSKVCWDWDDPQVVGKTMTFKIKFYRRNGRPYPISSQDSVLVEIVHGTHTIPPTVQLGSLQTNDVNVAHVAFTVHRAGEYKISIMVDAKHIHGSPFVKKFLPGNLDASKTGFVSHSSIVVCTQRVAFPLILEPRDEYGNLCNYAYHTDFSDNYKITVTETGLELKPFVPHLHIVYEKATKRVMLHLRLDKEGCFHAVATYNGVRLKNGEFTILVLNENDASLVKKNIAKKSHNIWYEARLLSPNNDKQQKPKKVYCYVSPKQLTVKEYYLKIFPKRLYTFRVCPSTKFQFLGFNNQYELGTFAVDDGSQAIEMAAKDRNIIAATFTNFLLKNIGGSETFKDKQDFFYHEIRQLHHKRSHDRLLLIVYRNNLLESTMKVTKHFSTSDWCKNFEISFVGEEGLDWGGVRREWFECLCTHLFDPSASGLFRRFKEDNQGLVHPNSSRPPHLKLKMYEFAGKLIGKCLYESSLGGSSRQLVTAKFTRSFLAQLIGLRVNYRYFEQDDPDYYITKIKYIEENDVDDMELVFAEEEYNNGQLTKVVELIPNGSKINVTNKNKLRYLDALAQYRLATSVKEEIESFLKGLNELIPDNLLSIFDENELELLMCGTGNYSITEFKEHHTVCGGSAEFRRVVDWFWTIVSGFTQEEMAKLLQFTTGCSQLPPGGFAELHPKLQITSSPTYGNLPTAHTCFNQLCLPVYDSMEEFQQALHVAINEGSQGFGLV